MDTLESRWRKSSFSGGNGGGCVEVASTPGVILVRDTTNRAGAVLAVPAAAWLRFTASLEPSPRTSASSPQEPVKGGTGALSRRGRCA